MIYAMDNKRGVLVEFKSPKEMDAQNGNGCRYKACGAGYARNYVRNGGVHETGLWVDSDGTTRYAPADPEGH
jgi:hypothetical protein